MIPSLSEYKTLGIINTLGIVNGYQPHHVILDNCAICIIY